MWIFLVTGVSGVAEATISGVMFLVEAAALTRTSRPSRESCETFPSSVST
jgi:hypothetical protein